MIEAIRKTEVLIEALPYIEAFRHKVIVIKYGGSAIVDKRKRKKVLQDIVFMSYSGMYPVLVHGGGPFINKSLKARNIISYFIKGLRVTDEKSLGVIKNVIHGLNRKIVGEITSLGGRAQGLRTDSCIIKANKATGLGNVGYVGKISSIKASKIREVFKRGAIPVISPLALGSDGKTYNINADQAAAAIAIALNAEKLALLTNVDGILKDKNNKNSLISSITAKNIRRLIAGKKIDTGMLPKVKACVDALRKGVKKIHIINGGLKHALLLEIFTDKGIGTQIIK